MLLGLGLRLLIATAAVATVAAIVIYVSGTINKSKIKQELAKKGIEQALLDSIDGCDNVVKLTDLENDNTIEIHGDDVSSSLYEGMTICA